MAALIAKGSFSDADFGKVPHMTLTYKGGQGGRKINGVRVQGFGAEARVLSFRIAMKSPGKLRKKGSWSFFGDELYRDGSGVNARRAPKPGEEPNYTLTDSELGGDGDL
jgi:hypothetical protein